MSPQESQPDGRSVTSIDLQAILSVAKTQAAAAAALVKYAAPAPTAGSIASGTLAVGRQHDFQFSPRADTPEEANATKELFVALLVVGAGKVLEKATLGIIDGDVVSLVKDHAQGVKEDEKIDAVIKTLGEVTRSLDQLTDKINRLTDMKPIQDYLTRLGQVRTSITSTWDSIKDAVNTVGTETAMWEEISKCDVGRPNVKGEWETIAACVLPDPKLHGDGLATLLQRYYQDRMIFDGGSFGYTIEDYRRDVTSWIRDLVELELMASSLWAVFLQARARYRPLVFSAGATTTLVDNVVAKTQSNVAQFKRLLEGEVLEWGSTKLLVDLAHHPSVSTGEYPRLVTLRIPSDPSRCYCLNATQNSDFLGQMGEASFDAAKVNHHFSLVPIHDGMWRIYGSKSSTCFMPPPLSSLVRHSEENRPAFGLRPASANHPYAEFWIVPTADNSIKIRHIVNWDGHQAEPFRDAIINLAPNPVMTRYLINKGDCKGQVERDVQENGKASAFCWLNNFTNYALVVNHVNASRTGLRPNLWGLIDGRVSKEPSRWQNDTDVSIRTHVWLPGDTLPIGVFRQLYERGFNPDGLLSTFEVRAFRRRNEPHQRVQSEDLESRLYVNKDGKVAIREDDSKLESVGRMVLELEIWSGGDRSSRKTMALAWFTENDPAGNVDSPDEKDQNRRQDCMRDLAGRWLSDESDVGTHRYPDGMNLEFRFDHEGWNNNPTGHVSLQVDNWAP